MFFQRQGAICFVFTGLVSRPCDQRNLGIQHNGLILRQVQHEIRLDPLAAFGHNGILG